MQNTGSFIQKAAVGQLDLLVRVSAAIVVALTLQLSMWMYGVRNSDPYLAVMIIGVLLALILFRGRRPDDIYMSRSFWSFSLSVVSRWMLFFAILLVLGYATKTSSIFSRRTLFTWVILTPPFLVLAEYAVESLVLRILTSGNKARRVIIVGANELGRSLATKLRGSPQFGVTVDGFFDDRSSDRLGGDQETPVLGKLQDVPDYVHRNNIDLIFLVLPIRNIQRVTELLDALHDTTASIYYVPDIFVFDLIQCRTGDVGGMPVIALCETPFHGSQGAIKRLSDYVIAATVLIVASPLLLAIAIAIKMSSPGSVIFKQRRYGLDGREIIVYKFRSMSVSEDTDNVVQAKRNDARVTRVGAFLRKYSLDELPQFINVLQGRMSVVGPRPHAIAHNEEYRSLIKGYMVRHKVNPGITGLAQVRGFRGETATVTDMQNRVEADLEYLRNWSLTMDLRIILKTVAMMFSDEMAY
jgi:putative colanic acid biosynthesis UDP-glucose lipid carrier transferase